MPCTSSTTALPGTFAPGNAAELAALKAINSAPAFRPVDTGGLNWAGALQVLRPPQLRKYSFLINFRGAPATRIAVWSGTDAAHVRELAWSNLTDADKERVKRITLLTTGDAS